MFRKMMFSSLLLCCFGSAQAALINFSGNIAYHNDVVIVEFSLENDATDVRIWTDSHGAGLNFDPITALFTAEGELLDENDDNDQIDPPSQNLFDSGFYLPFLEAGNYLFTVTAFPNFALGDMFSDGFTLDNEAPVAMAEWCQPLSDCNMGTFWSVQLDGVDSAGVVTDASGPATVFIFGLGLVGLRLRRK